MDIRYSQKGSHSVPMLLGTIFRSQKKRRPRAGRVYEEIARDEGNDHPLY